MSSSGRRTVTYHRKYLGDWKVIAYDDGNAGDPGFWVVFIPSKTEEDVMYNVIVEKDMTMECDCKGYKYRKTCIHVNAVKLKINEQAVK